MADPTGSAGKTPKAAPRGGAAKKAAAAKPAAVPQPAPASPGFTATTKAAATGATPPAGYGTPAGTSPSSPPVTTTPTTPPPAAPLSDLDPNSAGLPTCPPRRVDALPEFEDGEGLGVVQETIRNCADLYYGDKFDAAFDAVDALLERFETDETLDDAHVSCLLYVYEKRRVSWTPHEERRRILRTVFGEQDDGPSAFDRLMLRFAKDLVHHDQATLAPGAPGSAFVPPELAEQAVRSSAADLQAYLSHAIGAIGGFLAAEVGTRLTMCFEILDSVGRTSCVGGMRNPGLFDVIADVAGVDGGSLAVARSAELGIQGRRFLIGLSGFAGTGDAVLSTSDIATLAKPAYGWLAAYRGTDAGMMSAPAASTNGGFQPAEPTDVPPVIRLLPAREVRRF